MMPFEPRRDAYEADVTFGTNSEFGFDYLRDNMAVSLDGVVQRGHPYAIVDEVDSILIDEARTPLIISGEPQTAAQIYYDFARVAPQLVAHRSSPGDPKGYAEQVGADYEYDEKHKTVAVTEAGVAKVERALRIENLYAPQNSQLVNHLIQALKAQSLFQRDIDYVIQDDEVKIVDEFTGRIMEGRRWSEGLHQAVEAKEGVRIQEEHQTMATITLQNYFRLYDKLGGMTGTAKTEEKEFVEIYNLNVVEIPTNVPVARNDEQDYVFKTKEGKFGAVARDIKECAERGQPVLVGTIAVETSEYLSQLLTRQGVKHNVLNAKEHAREAEIIKDAGQPGAVTIATNMAGRGVDIKLGEGVLELGGLYVLGTERHESRRIDNQLRGRSGRQGDPGADALLPLRRGRPRAPVRRRPDQGDHGAVQDPGGPADGGEDPQPADRGRAEEGRGAELRQRKNVLKYDDVLNRHRGRIYEQRRQVLEGDDMSEQVKLWIDEVVEDTVRQFTDEAYAEEWDLEALTNAMAALYQTEITAKELKEDLGDITRETLIEEFQTDARDEYEAKEEEFGSELMRELERFVILQVVDVRWREHLDHMDYVREGIGLRAMAQKDPLVEYTAEGERVFTELSRVDPQRGRAPSLPRRARARAGAAGARPAAAGQRRRHVRARDRRRRGRDRRGRGHDARPLAGGRADRGSHEARSQRPLLVRVGQEVQEVPRRLTRDVRHVEVVTASSTGAARRHAP